MALQKNQHVIHNRRAAVRQNLLVSRSIFLRLSASTLFTDDTHENSSEEEPTLTSPTPLRPLTSLKWPYVPDESAFPDPLKKNDPKTLQLSQYEAIGNVTLILLCRRMIFKLIIYYSNIACYSKHSFFTQESS